MEFPVSELSERERYKLMSGSIVPRPIAWVSTVDAAGVRNLAPFSYFTAVCADPPTVLFCSGVRGWDGGQKDTYQNVRATGEFVINFVTEALAEAMNETAAEVGPDVDEFERAGVTPVPSVAISVPRVAESPIHFECALKEIVTIHDQPGGGHIIIGTVVHMHFDDSIYREGHYIDMDAYKPLARLAGPAYARLGERFNLQRPPREK